jgi:triosephosphate isomerase
MIRKKIIAGNWKMNKTSADAVALAAELTAQIGRRTDVDVVICPPFTALESTARAVDGSLLKLGAQNLHPEASGAFTGEVSAPMLRALFVTHVILGHSERRTLFGEGDPFINRKVHAALKHQLRPILCVGESLGEREAKATLKVVQAQLEGSLSPKASRSWVEPGPRGDLGAAPERFRPKDRTRSDVAPGVLTAALNGAAVRKTPTRDR